MGLRPLPRSFGATRDALHRVAEEVVAPARKPDNEIALTQTSGGFGTPPFEHGGDEWQVRVDGAELVVLEGGAERREAIASLAQAAELVGTELFPAGPPGDATPLELDRDAATVLAELYAFARNALEAHAAAMSPADDPSDVILWPEHFDIAFEAGPEPLGRRANYGVSPGDDGHREPYAYVGAWHAQPRGDLWNATGFSGAELSYAALVAADDPDGLVADFFTVRREALDG